METFEKLSADDFFNDFFAVIFLVDLLKFVCSL